MTINDQLRGSDVLETSAPVSSGWAPALIQLIQRRIDYQLYENYYGGRHALAFASEKFRNAFGRLFRAFADNLIPIVVDTLAERLQIVEFATEEGTPQEAKDAWDLWNLNHMDRRSKRVHIESFKTGDSYVLVWPSKSGDVTFYPQKARTMTVIYDEEEIDTILYALKAWEDVDGYQRVNLYFPDRIEKWISKRKSTTLLSQENKYRPFAAPVLHDYGRVPVFHFGNNVSEGELGMSEERDVIPIQDALNKSVLDMMVAMEFVALPQRWATGIEIEFDEKTGIPKEPYKPGVDRMWATPSTEVKFGEFGQANLSQFLEASDSFRMEMARISGTPLHYMNPTSTSVPASGEALKTLEARFTKKLLDRQQSFGTVWAEAMEFALEMQSRAYDGIKLATVWENPAPHSTLEDTQVAINKQTLGVPQDQIWLELGYTRTQVSEMGARVPSPGALVEVSSGEADTPAAPLVSGKRPVMTTGTFMLVPAPDSSVTGT